MAGLEERLELDIADALRSIDRIEATLTASAKRFKVALSDAVGILATPVKVDADARPVTTEIDRAVAAADTSVAVTDVDTGAVTTGLKGAVDAADIGGDISDAVRAADTSLEFDPNTTQLTLDLDGAVAAADTTVTPTLEGPQQLTLGIEGAIEAADTSVSVTDQDIASLTGQITGAVDAADTTVSVDADTTGLKETGTDLGFIGAQAGVAAANVDGAKESFRSLGEVAKVALGAVVVQQTLAFLRESVDVASNLSEQISATSVVFGNQQDRIRDWAKTSDESLGLAEDQALETANALGGLFVALGLTERAAADLGPVVIQRAADIASLKNLDVPDALEKIRSGLVGEVEPLRSLGVSFNAAQVEAKAFELGLANANGEVDEAAKVQARFAIILDQTAVAEGNFALTSEGLANSQRILSAEVRNLRASIGEALLPEALKLVDLASDELLPFIEQLAESAFPLLTSVIGSGVPILRSFMATIELGLPVLDGLVSIIDAIPEPVLAIIGSFLAVRSTLGPLPGLLSNVGRGLANLAVPGPAIAGAFNGVASGGGGVAAALGGMVSPIALVTVGLTAAIAVVSAHAEAKREQQRRIAEVRDALLEENDALEENVTAILKSRLESRNQIDDLNRVRFTIGDVRELAQQGADGYREFIERLASTGEIGPATRAQLLDLSAAQAGYRTEVELTNALSLETGKVNTGLVRTFTEFQRELQEGAKAAIEQKIATGELEAGFVTLDAKRNQFSDGTTDYIAALREAEGTQERYNLHLIESGQAHDSARAANASLAEQYKAYQTAIADAVKGTSDLDIAQSTLGDRFDDVVNRFIEGTPTVETFAQVVAETGLTTDTVAAILGHARDQAAAFIDTVVQGIPGVTSATADLSKDTGIKDYLAGVKADVEAAAKFLDNIAILSRRGADDLAQAFATRGVESAKAAQEAVDLGNKQLTAAEQQLEKAKVTDANNIARAQSTGTQLVSTIDSTNKAMGAVPGPNLAGPIGASGDQARRTLREKMEAIEGDAASGGNNAGSAFGGGFGTGIFEAYRPVTQAAQALASAAVETAKTTLRAFSPSRVAIDLGHDVGEGFAIGIADTRIVELAAAKMARAAVPALPSVTVTGIPSVPNVTVNRSVGTVGGPDGGPDGGGPFLVIESGGALARFDVTIGPGAGADDIVEVMRTVAQTEVAGVLVRVLDRVQARTGGR